MDEEKSCGDKKMKPVEVLQIIRNLCIASKVPETEFEEKGQDDLNCKPKEAHILINGRASKVQEPAKEEEGEGNISLKPEEAPFILN